MKKVLITVKGIQSNEQDSDSIEFMTEGTLRKSGDDVILSYNDTQILGDSSKTPVKTRLTVHKNDRVTIERGGALASRMIIQKGVRTDCFYKIPQGDLVLGIYGKQIKNGVTDTGGNLSMVYTVDTDARLLSENKIEITVKEV